MMDLSSSGHTGGKDFLVSLNPASLQAVTAYVEPSLAQAAADDKFQFERRGQFGCGITLLCEVSLRRKAPAPCVADQGSMCRVSPYSIG